MSFPYENDRYRPHRRHTVAADLPATHHSNSWHSNGLHYTVESTSFASPNLAFGIMGANARSPFYGDLAPSQPRRQAHGSGLFGTAFSLLGDVLAAQQQGAIHGNVRRSTRQASGDDLAYGEHEWDNQPRSFVSRFAERLLNNSQRSHDTARKREASPARRRPGMGNDHRSRSYRTYDFEPSWARNRAAYVEEVSDEYEDEDYDSDSDDFDIPQRQKPRRAFTANDASVIEALQNEAEYHKLQAKKCRERIQRLSREPNASTAQLQALLNELKCHENTRETALQNLRLVRDRVGSSSSARHVPTNGRTSRKPTPQSMIDDEFIREFMSDDFDTFFQSCQQAHPLFAEFEEFDSVDGGTPFASFHHFFDDFSPRTPFGEDSFFASPRAAFNQRGTGTYTNTGPHHQQPSGFGTFSAPQACKPPATLLKPEEAKRLFQTYNQRWNTLSNNDPNIPYPARNFHRAALSARNSIWAPLVGSPIEEWSEEIVMQANAQALFLGTVGISPQYTEAPGTCRIVMGYNKAQASPQQVKELLKILKNEKMRWHSDRLGRRNGGMEGPNEVLQRDEKARAVFHAVCELMDSTK